MSPEVLIYIQSVRIYFENNEEARNYFVNNSNENEFFDKLTKISQKNYESLGRASLTEVQFELLRALVNNLDQTDLNDVQNDNSHIFYTIKGFGIASLN